MLFVHRMAERSGGNIRSTCVRCRKPLPEPGAHSCASCGAPQQQMRTCIACGGLVIPGAQHCVYCRTDQNNPVLCVNPQCRRLLLPSMTLCPYCGEPQLQESASFYQVRLSQGDPSYVPGTHPGGHPLSLGIHDQRYPEMGAHILSMPYSPGPQREPKVNRCNIL